MSTYIEELEKLSKDYKKLAEINHEYYRSLKELSELVFDKKSDLRVENSFAQDVIRGSNRAWLEKKLSGISKGCWKSSMERLWKDYKYQINRLHIDTFRKLELFPYENFYGEAFLEKMEHNLERLLSERSERITTKTEMDNFIDFVYKIDKNSYGAINSINCFYKNWREHQMQILGLKEYDLSLESFDLKNTEDIKRCKQLYPLAVEYPRLFYGWYKNGKIMFTSDYENGLEKKRKEINAKLADKKAKTTNGFKRGAIKAAMKVVPEKLGKKASKLEQKIADIAYRKKQAGRK